MTLPGALWLPHNALSPAWLYQQLLAIWGASIIGLQIADDAVVVAGNATHWPARVGADAPPFGPQLFTTASVNGRQVLRNTDVTTLSGYQATLTATPGAGSTAITVCRADVLPFADYSVAFCTNDIASYLLGAVTTSKWWLPPGIAMRNGAFNDDALTSLEVYEAPLISGLNTVILGAQTATPSRNWVGDLALFLFLSTTGTTIQRLQTQVVLEQYYRPARALLARTVLDLYIRYGANCLGYWSGHDIVVDGIGDVIHLPARIGPPAELVFVERYQTTIVNGILAMHGPVNSSTRYLGMVLAALGAPAVSAWSIVSPGILPLAAGNDQSILAYNDLGASMAKGVAGTNTLGTDDLSTLYRNGVIANTLIAGPQIYESLLPARASTTLTLQGSPAGGRFGFCGDWLGAMALAADPGLTRAQTVGNLKTLYQIP